MTDQATPDLTDLAMRAMLDPAQMPALVAAHSAAALRALRSMGEFLIECADWFTTNPSRKFRFCQMPRDAFDLVRSTGESVIQYSQHHMEAASAGLPKAADVRVIVRRPVARRGNVTPLPDMVVVADLPAAFLSAETDEVGEWVFRKFPPVFSYRD